jgi:hypothetical protein
MRSNLRDKLGTKAAEQLKAIDKQNAKFNILQGAAKITAKEGAASATSPRVLSQAIARDTTGRQFFGGKGPMQDLAEAGIATVGRETPVMLQTSSRALGKGTDPAPGLKQAMAAGGRAVLGETAVQKQLQSLIDQYGEEAVLQIIRGGRLGGATGTSPEDVLETLLQ